jgi:hypothetical protein
LGIQKTIRHSKNNHESDKDYLLGYDRHCCADDECRIVFNGIKKTLKELCGNDRVDLHVGKDAQGEIYLLSKT